jgi:hypothetical protein
MDTASHWDAANERFCFAKLPEQQINTETVERATKVAAFVSQDLHIQPPRIVWVCPAKPAEAAAKLGNFRRRVEEDECHPDFARTTRDIEEGGAPWNFGLHEIWIRSELTATPNLEFAVALALRYAWQKQKV